ncbi:MAG: 50S ribosomal protein L25 [Dehalococcoidia bacterium]|nr:50S ribosomal protein L25 [Dehalococcoidia bacterium]
MNQLELSVAPRSVLGKRVRALRRGGLTPANVYGHGVESRALQIETVTLVRTLRALERNAILSLCIEGEKAPRPVMVRDIQRNPVSDRILHVDFYQVSLTEKMRADVPLLLTGKAPAVDDFGGILLQSLESISVEALPADMPSHVEVDISVLSELDSSLHVKDLVLDPKLHVMTDLDVVIARVASPRTGVEAAIAEEEAAADAEREEAVVEEEAGAAAPAPAEE